MLDEGTDYFTTPSQHLAGLFKDTSACCSACGKTDDVFFTHTADNNCWCHPQQGQKQKKAGYTSGSCRSAPPAPPAGSTVTTYTGSDPTAAATAAAAADVAVVFVSTSSSEGSDRKTLSFSDEQNAIVAAVAKAQKKTVRCYRECMWWWWWWWWWC